MVSNQTELTNQNHNRQKCKMFNQTNVPNKIASILMSGIVISFVKNLKKKGVYIPRFHSNCMHTLITQEY